MESFPRILKFINGIVAHDNDLVKRDLVVDSKSGKILAFKSTSDNSQLMPDEIIDLNGKVLSPGFIDVQLNGSHQLEFSAPPVTYAEEIGSVNRLLIHSGVTSYMPSVTSSRPQVYPAVLPHLGPSGSARIAEDGAESLGVHVEGPFISPARNGIHNVDVLLEAGSFADLEVCYGAEHLKSGSTIKKITAAPELGNMMSMIPELTSRNIVFSIGHTDASLSEGQKAIEAGATMVTHTFNAMRPFGHRNPGIVGLLGQSESTPPSPRSSQSLSQIPSSRSVARQSLSLGKNSKAALKESARPFFGLIADGVHVHSSSINIAYQAHPEGTILVTDVMKLAGCPDGTYDWTNGDRITKEGSVLTLEANGRIAGSAVTMIECINNFHIFIGCVIGEALACVTSHPAKMLGEEKIKGRLEGGMDADLVVLDTDHEGELVIDQVWKFGKKVYG
jgi:N-acetylglucosamine-6-phosphate deacetylase